MSNYVTHNSQIHDLIAPIYESRHGEIFNKTEQQRIHELLTYAVSCICTGTSVPRILDFGAGTGNLSRHLLSIGADVIASDVSTGCLRELECSATEPERLELSLLNGQNLSQFCDNTFDMVATYSVLHHVSDYLSIVKEFVRVVKPGGIIYIDHEVCPSYWENIPEYMTYCRILDANQVAPRLTFFDRFLQICLKKNRWRYLRSALWTHWNKVTDEGDIHVHPEDHIQWPEIKCLLEPFCGIILEQDYLVCRELTYPAPVWEAWRNLCVDMRLLVARKN